jgi:hypothetical protein
MVWISQHDMRVEDDIELYEKIVGIVKGIGKTKGVVMTNVINLFKLRFKQLRHPWS